MNKPIKSTISKTRSGSYKIRWRDRNRNFQKTFKTKLDALSCQSALLKGQKNKTIAVNIRFEDFAKIWHERHCLIEIHEGTIKMYNYS